MRATSTHRSIGARQFAALDDLDVLCWLVAVALGHRLDVLDDVHATSDLAEDDVLAIEPRSLDSCNKIVERVR